MKFTAMIIAIVAALSLAGCGTLEKKVRTIPPFAFKSWSHSDRYGVFTDSINVSGVAWQINGDGSVDAVIDHYDGWAAYAGTVGPHDTIEGLKIHFPADSAQAAAIRAQAATSATAARALAGNAP
jgi:hypothetical protein